MLLETLYPQSRPVRARAAAESESESRKGKTLEPLFSLELRLFLKLLSLDRSRGTRSWLSLEDDRSLSHWAAPVCVTLQLAARLVLASLAPLSLALTPSCR